MYCDTNQLHMINADSLSAIGSLVKDAKSAVIFLKAKPSYDQVLSALALANSLEQSQVAVEIACSDLGSVADRFLDAPTHTQVEQSQTGVANTGIASIKNKLGNRNLTVSFPYSQEAVDSVSYHISDDGSQFYLVVKPQTGALPLDSNAVEFDYSGVEADVAFTIGVHDWSALEYLYEAHEQLFRNTAVISIHNVQTELTPFALDTSSFGSMSEGLVWLLEGLQLVPNTIGASYLLRGIEEATDSFRSLATTADTFESVAKLMRMGARRAPRQSHTRGQIQFQKNTSTSRVMQQNLQSQQNKQVQKSTPVHTNTSSKNELASKNASHLNQKSSSRLQKSPKEELNSKSTLAGTTSATGTTSDGTKFSSRSRA